jgi:ribosomal protein S18 acetylase RimI-like enzyme
VSSGVATNAPGIVAKFITEGRDQNGLEGVLALEGEQVLGSCLYQLLISPFPEVLRRDRRLRGYLWSVYVEPAGRNKGIAKKLTKIAVEKLARTKCTDVILHASEAAEGVYAKLGFNLAKEMRLKLQERQPSQ